MTTYITKQGDTWDIIARKTLGNEKLMGKIIDLNREHRFTLVFSAGVVLTIPEVEQPASKASPPWR